MAIGSDQLPECSPLEVRERRPRTAWHCLRGAAFALSTAAVFNISFRFTPADNNNAERGARLASPPASFHIAASSPPARPAAFSVAEVPWRNYRLH